MSTDPSFFDSIDASDAELEAATPAPATADPVTAPEPAAETTPATPAPVATTIEPARDPSSGRYVKAPEPAPAAPETAPAVTTEAAKVIPLAAHLEERSRWKTELATLQERLAKLETPAKPPAPEPDFIEDPKGYVDAKTAKALDALKAVEQKLEPVQQATEQQQFLATVARVESEFVGHTPDYYEALAHVRQVRIAQLAELYPQATQEQIGQQIVAEEVQVARSLMAQGRNPSETLYRLAKTYGYAPKAATPATPVAPAPLPKVPQAPVADPAATLGSSGAAADTVEDDGLADAESAEDVLTIALRERFKR